MKKLDPRLGDGPVAPPFDHTRSVIFVPWIAKDTAEELSGFVSELFALMVGDPDQERPICRANKLLMSVAQARADDMLHRNYFGHETPDGKWPNGIVREAGYRLPKDWPDDTNYIESIGINYLTPVEQWQGWLNSPVHRNHVLGLSPSFADETEIGMGYAIEKGTLYPSYWVAITCPPQEKP